MSILASKVCAYAMQYVWIVAGMLKTNVPHGVDGG